jgi:hypothetical protein
MTRPERAILGMGVAAIPGALVAVWLVPSGSFHLALAVPVGIELLGAFLALWRVPPFPWLEARLSDE